MKTLELLFRLGSRDIYPAAAGDKLRLSKPCPPALRAAVIEHKQAILSHLTAYPRANQVPDELPLSTVKVDPDKIPVICDLICWQGVALLQFISHHAIFYRSKFANWTENECQLAAARDVLEWQEKP